MIHGPFGLLRGSVLGSAITSGFVSRAETRRRATGEDPVIQKLDQLTRELQAVKAELEHPLRPTVSPDSTPEAPKPAVHKPLANP